LKPLVVVFGLCAAIAVAGTAHAYRPFDGTDADVAEKGTIELELGPVGYYARASQHYLIAPGAVLNYGLVDRVELVLQGFDFVDIDKGAPSPRARLLETGLFAKIVLRKGCLQHATGVSIATEVGPLLPTVNDQNAFGASAGGILTQCWGDQFAVHYNVQAELTREQNLDLFGGAILEGPASLRVRPVAEFFVEQEFNVATTYSALLGAIWRARESLDFDVGLRAARINSDSVGEIRLGFTWTFL
jgi:hypothetical protein